MKILSRWLLYYIFLIAIFFTNSAFGQSPEIETDAEFEFKKSLLSESNFRESILYTNPYFVIGLDSEFVKKLTLIKPDRSMAESISPHISVRGATFVYQKDISDPKVTKPSLEYCQTGLGYNSMQDLETSLLTQAKQVSVHDLLDEQITSIIELASCEPSRDDVAELLTDSIQILETPKYSNGREFAEVCITISPYIEEEPSIQLDLESIADEVCKEP